MEMFHRLIEWNHIMFEPKEIENRIRETTGEIRRVLPIEKGFSNEKKWRVVAKNGDYLLRLTSSDIIERKKEENRLMLRLYKAGVTCNEPLDLFESSDRTRLYSLYRYLPGQDAEGSLAELSPLRQYEIGKKAGNDLKKINGITSDRNTWYERKWKKHGLYLDKYETMDYRFHDDRKVLKFIETNYSETGAAPDVLQHDDFHLGNILVHHDDYGGILDFNRYDWGDPLHEFVKLEWFTWPVSKAFAVGQVKGYFGENGVSDKNSRQMAVYIAMSIFSTIVWTLRFHPQTMAYIEKRIEAILAHYRFFEKTVPDWVL